MSKIPAYPDPRHPEFFARATEALWRHCEASRQTGRPTPWWLFWEQPWAQDVPGVSRWPVDDTQGPPNVIYTDLYGSTYSAFRVFGTDASGGVLTSSTYLASGVPHYNPGVASSKFDSFNRDNCGITHTGRAVVPSWMLSEGAVDANISGSAPAYPFPGEFIVKLVILPPQRVGSLEETTQYFRRERLSRDYNYYQEEPPYSPGRFSLKIATREATEAEHLANPDIFSPYPVTAHDDLLTAHTILGLTIGGKVRVAGAESHTAELKAYKFFAFPDFITTTDLESRPPTTTPLTFPPGAPATDSKSEGLNLGVTSASDVIDVVASGNLIVAVTLTGYHISGKWCHQHYWENILTKETPQYSEFRLAPEERPPPIGDPSAEATEYDSYVVYTRGEAEFVARPLFDYTNDPYGGGGYRGYSHLVRAVADHPPYDPPLDSGPLGVNNPLLTYPLRDTNIYGLFTSFNYDLSGTRVVQWIGNPLSQRLQKMAYWLGDPYPPFGDDPLGVEIEFGHMPTHDFNSLYQEEAQELWDEFVDNGKPPEIVWHSENASGSGSGRVLGVRVFSYTVYQPYYPLGVVRRRPDNHRWVLGEDHPPDVTYSAALILMDNGVLRLECAQFSTVVATDAVAFAGEGLGDPRFIRSDGTHRIVVISQVYGEPPLPRDGELSLNLYPA